jgi:hypothetical protein
VLGSLIKWAAELFQVTQGRLVSRLKHLVILQVFVPEPSGGGLGEKSCARAEMWDGGQRPPMAYTKHAGGKAGDPKVRCLVTPAIGVSPWLLRTLTSVSSSPLGYPFSIAFAGSSVLPVIVKVGQNSVIGPLFLFWTLDLLCHNKNMCSLGKTQPLASLTFS